MENKLSLKAQYIKLYIRLMYVRQDKERGDSNYILLNDKTLVSIDEEAVFHFLRHKAYKEDALIKFWYKDPLKDKEAPLTHFMETPFNKIKDLTLLRSIIKNMEDTLSDWTKIYTAQEKEQS